MKDFFKKAGSYFATFLGIGITVVLVFYLIGGGLYYIYGIPTYDITVYDTTTSESKVYENVKRATIKESGAVLFQTEKDGFIYYLPAANETVTIMHK